MHGICNQHNSNELHLTLICSPSAPSPARGCDGACRHQMGTLTRELIRQTGFWNASSPHNAEQHLAQCAVLLGGVMQKGD